MNVIAIVKEHPIPIGIGVVVILLIVMSRGGSSVTSNSGASSNNAGAYLQSQSIAANSNAQIAALNTQAQLALGAQNIERYSIAEKAASERAGMATSLFAAITGTNAQLRVADTAAMSKNMQLSLNHTESLNAMRTNLESSKAVIAGNIQVNGDNLAANQRAIETDSNFKLAYLGKQTDGNLAALQSVGNNNVAAVVAAGANAVNMQNAQGDIAKTLLGMNIAFTDKNLTTMLGSAERIAFINGNSVVNQINAQNAVGMKNAEIKEDGQDNAQTMAWVSTIGSIVGAYLNGSGS